MTPASRATPELNALLDLFYQDASRLGTFTELVEQDLPAIPRQLLAHDQHMTVTVEAFHGCPVTLQVIETHVTATHYSRKILLRRQSDNRVVQFGIVRLALSLLAPEVRAEIESQRTPLGRVLIEANILRKVRLLSLWRIEAGEDLSQLFQVPRTDACYGRTALIYCDGVPAVELLEIVTPTE